VLAMVLIPAASASVCDPLTFGAVGDGTTDNTAAIQNAVNACAAQGGGTVELRVVGNQAIYLTGPFTLTSHIHLQVDQGVTLQGTNEHSRYVPAWINWVYQPKEALISATGATDVGVIGAGIIDGAGGRLQPNGSPSWWTLQQQSPAAKSARPFLLEFYQCDHVTISGVTLQNSPFWTQVLRFSNTVTVSGVTILAPVTAPNSDGVDVVGSSNLVLTNLNISVGDDNIAFKSGLPIDPTDPRQAGLPRKATSQVQVSNITTQNGDGIVFGSEAVNGVNNVSIENVHYAGTAYGIRIKSARDRGGQIYNITADGLVMDGVTLPLSISDYYTSPGGVGPIEPPYEAAQPITSTTPYVHDITIQNVVAISAAQHSVIEGLPESCIHDVKLNNVSIQTKDVGITLRHMTGTFTSLTSTPAPPNPPFIVQENVTVGTAGTTPPIPATPPRAGQVACSAQVVPPP
jgi:polygalacturonase